MITIELAWLKFRHVNNKYIILDFLEKKLGEYNG